MVGIRKIGVVFGSLLLAFAMLPSAFAAAGGPPATFTTINSPADGGDHCKNGQPDATTVVNCNIYDGKQYVWLNGGPSNAALADGTYFFAVLVPGGQPDPNDGGAKNLSDTTAAPYGSGALNADGSAIPSGDLRANRTFTVSGGSIDYRGSHDFDSHMIRLMPFDDTTNEGGVYILGICRLATPTSAVDPRSCKYDAFKVQAPETPVTVAAVLSGTKYLDANTNGQMDPGETGIAKWTISITGGTTTTTVLTDGEGNWSFTTPAVNEGTAETFTVSEVQQSGYEQTGNTVDQFSATGGVTVALSNKIYTLTLPNTGPGSASGLNFGNIPLASALTAAKTAAPAFTRTFAWQIAKAVDKTEIDTADGATFTYTVTVTRSAGTDSGWAVGGNINVSNSNAAAAQISGITDAIDDANATCLVTGTFPATIPASGSSSFAYACTYAAVHASANQTNTATITWADQTLSNATLLKAGSATATAPIAWGDPTTIVDGSASVSDPLDLSAPRAFSDSGSFSYSHTYGTDPAGTCTKHDNTATFTTDTTSTHGSASQEVTVCVGADLTVSKTAATAFTRTFGWTIAKDVDKTTIKIASGGSATFNYTVNVSHNAGVDSAWTTAGTITVTNPNDWETVTADVTDAINNGGACAVTGGTSVLLAKSGSAVLAYTCTYSVAPTAAAGLNTATAAWDKAAANTPDSSASGAATGTFGSPTTIVNGTVSVSDSLGGTLGSATYTDASPKTFTYSTTFTGDKAGTCTTHDNTATFTTNTTGATGSASQSVQVCVGLDLTVTKAATPTFTRTYGWTTSKAVDKTLVKQVGGSATFNYTVVAAQTGLVDTGWAVSGTITVSNPNDWEAITTTVTDTINNGGNCTVTNGTRSIAASSSADFAYTCTFALAPNPLLGGTNTGTASWDKAAAFTPDASANGTAGVSFATPTTVVNATVTVTDTFNGGTPTALGKLTATDGAPFATQTFTYSRSISVPAFDCKSYTNTATIVETGLTASRTVTVCGPEKTGGLTMGFWQNKNGQGIITGGAATAAVCNSGTWLRQYAPFQDLSATANCAAVASYVYNVVKIASSAGDSMNPMLKAQMLATALDVYFSDPALGTNKIGAPGPIGSASIDLTKICTNIGTCTTFINSSSSFGGATSMTVSQILTYAASQSNAGGSMWYANLKATQELAKDVFDAINNQVAFAP